MSNTIGPVDIEFLLKSLNFNQESEKMKAGIRGITATAQQEANNTNAIFKNLASGIGVYFSASFLKSFVSEIANVRGEFQQLEIGLTTILKSKSEADRLMKQVVDFAVTTPFSLKDVSTGAKQLLAYGFAAKDVVSNIKMLGDVSAGLSIPISDLIYLYGTLNTQGRAYTRDILQFTSRGIPIISELAKQYGVTKEQISKMVEAGEVGFPAVEKAFKSMTSEGGTFFNLIDNISTTIPVQISNFKDAFTKELNDIGKANEGLISGTISSATLMVGSFDKVLDVVKVLVATYGVYKAATIAVAVADSYSAAAKAAALTTTSLMSTETVKLTFAQYASAKAQGTLNAVMSVNPYVLAISGIAALITALYVFGDATDEAAESQAKIDQGVNDTRAKIEAMVIAINSEKTANADKAEALKELNGIMSSTVGILDAKTLATQKGKDAIDQYIDSIRKQAEIEDLTNKLSKNMSEQDRIGSGNLSFAEKFAQLNYHGTDAAENKRRDEVYLSGVMFNLKEEESLLKKQLELKMAVKKEEGNALDLKKRTLDVIEQEIEAQKKLQKETSNNSEYNSFQKNIDALEAEKIAITGKEKKSEAARKEKEDIKSTIEASKEYLDIQQKIVDKLKDLDNANQQKNADLGMALVEEIEFLKRQLAALSKQTTTNSQSGTISTIPYDTTMLAHMKLLTAEQRKQLEAQSRQLGIDEEAAENWEIKSQMILAVSGLLSQMTDELAKQLGLTDQQVVALKGTAELIGNLASGNYIGAAFSMIGNVAKMMINTPVKLSEHFESINKQFGKLIDSLNIAEQSLSNIGKDSSLLSLRIVKSEILSLADDAKTLNDELAKSSTGRRRETNMSLPAQDLVKQAVDLNAEIDKLSSRLLQGDISDDQRKAIKAVLDSYNELLAKIDATVQDITGTTVSDLSRGLADAFLSGEDAAEAWGQKVDDIIKNVISRQLTSQLLTKPITDAVNILVNDTGDGLTTDEASKFKKTMDDLYASTSPAFEAVQKSLQKAGFNMNSSSSSSAITGIQASASADAVNAMVGQLTAVRVDIKSILVGIASGQDDASRTLLYMKQIADNTSYNKELVPISGKLDNIEKVLKERL